MLGNFLVAAQLAVSQEGLSSMEIVGTVKPDANRPPLANGIFALCKYYSTFCEYS
jgi:hypothetical protein